MNFYRVSQRAAAVKQITSFGCKRDTYITRAIPCHSRAFFPVGSSVVFHNASSPYSSRRPRVFLHPSRAHQVYYSTIKVKPTIKVTSMGDIHNLISRVGDYEDQCKELLPIREDFIKKYETAFAKAIEPAFKHIHEMLETLLKYWPREKEFPKLLDLLKKDATKASKYFDEAETAFKTYRTELGRYLETVRVAQANNQLLRDSIKEADAWLKAKFNWRINEGAARLSEYNKAQSEVENCEKLIKVLEMKIAGFEGTKFFSDFLAGFRKGFLGIFKPSKLHTLSDVEDEIKENRKPLIILLKQKAAVEEDLRKARQRMNDNYPWAKDRLSPSHYLGMSGGPLKDATFKLYDCKRLIDVEEVRAIHGNSAADRMYNDYFINMMVLVENFKSTRNLHRVAKDLVRIARLTQDTSFEEVVRKYTDCFTILASLPKELKYHDDGSGRLLIDDLNDLYSITYKREFNKPPHLLV